MELLDKKKIFAQARDGDAVKLERMEELTDDLLADVAGGFREDMNGLYTKGLNIECPYCRNKSKNIGYNKMYMDDSMHTVEYKCTCGRSFVVDGDNGFTYKKSYWVSACEKMGYSYPF